MAKIPHFKTDAEAAEFWDSHSLADFDEDLEQVDDLEFKAPQKHVISLRLDPEDIQRLKLLARHKGIGHSTLARIWVKEKLTELSRKIKP
jgi:predicted DNA binding CopG/RHH family protein